MSLVDLDTGAPMTYAEARRLTDTIRASFAAADALRAQAARAGIRLSEGRATRAAATTVYFIQEAGSGAIKIGSASHPRARLRDLQVANPNPLRLLATEPGGQAREFALHARFASARLRGEWFSPTAELREYVKAVAS